MVDKKIIGIGCIAVVQGFGAFGDRFSGRPLTASPTAPQKGVVDYLNDMSEEKCSSRFIAQEKIRTVTQADGTLKLKDPYGFHTCCNFDDVNCGTPQKFFSFDRTQKACKPVYLRRLCPDLLNNLLAIKDHLNLFSRRDDCRSVCTPPELVPTVATVAVEDTDDSDESETSEEANGNNEFNMEWRGVNRMGPSGGINPNNHFSPFASIYSIMQPFFVNRPSFGASSNEMEMMQFDAIENKQENPCHLPMDKGYAQILRKTAMWYFNQESGDCESFLWRGAGGNNNRFVTYDMCATVCKNDAEDERIIGGNENIPLPASARRANLAPPADICSQSPPKSSCGFANIATRFYFDKSDGKCHIYLSTECDFCKLGNCNSFATKDDCKTTCMKKRPLF
jgi:hypothetical protein